MEYLHILADVFKMQFGGHFLSIVDRKLPKKKCGLPLSALHNDSVTGVSRPSQCTSVQYGGGDKVGF